jgi:hypothetical protein
MTLEAPIRQDRPNIALIIDCARFLGEAGDSEKTAGDNRPDEPAPTWHGIPFEKREFGVSLEE